MAVLSDFSDEEKESIVSLPYRAGMNISYAEDEDGEEDDVREMQALEMALLRLRSEHEGRLNAEIIAEIIAQRDKWETWSQGVFNMEPQCKQAMVALKTKADISEIKAYIDMVVEIAQSVAQAHGEFGEPAVEKGFFGKIVDSLTGKGQAAHHPMNMSAGESDAIKSIKTALKKYAKDAS